jgi:hypothetical protein
MALFHFHVTQLKRSAGQSAVAAAAYRAGEKLHSTYYGEDADYTSKGGVILTDILLPPHAPPEYADRETLWNAVENVERHPKAQLAYSFDIALQNEFSLDENIALVRQFLLDEFVSRGMIVDFAVHDPDKNGGIQNPHFHVMCPIRPLNPDGTWGAKQRREYVLDENGERVKDEAGNDVFNAVPTTDWGKPETLEHWRKAWAELCNAKFAEKGLNCRIDHRSYERQGVEQLPTVHEGPAVRQMEVRGIRTDKGDLNRWIRRVNRLRRNISAMLADLFDRLKEIKSELASPQDPTLAELITDYYNGRNAGAWSLNAKLGNLKSMSQMVLYLQENGLRTAADLEARAAERQTVFDQKKAAMKATETKLKEVANLLRQAQNYAETKSVYEEWCRIKFKGPKEKFKAAHEDELRKYHAAQRKLQPYFKDGKLPLTAWRKEQAALQGQYTEAHAELDSIHKDVQNLRQITLAVRGASQKHDRREKEMHHQRFENR